MLCNGLRRGTPSAFLLVLLMFIEHLLYTTCCVKCLAWIILLNSHNNLMQYAWLWSLFYRWGTWGLERLPGMKQWGCSRLRFELRFACLWPYNHHLCAPKGQSKAAGSSIMKSSLLTNLTECSAISHTLNWGWVLDLFPSEDRNDALAVLGIAWATTHTHRDTG